MNDDTIELFRRIAREEIEADRERRRQKDISNAMLMSNAPSHEVAGALIAAGAHYLAGCERSETEERS